MLHFFTVGTILGLSAGFAPGPLLTLVITETLQNDIGSGIKVAISPIITDLPIIILTIFVLSKLSSFHGILGAITILGGGFVLYIGYESFSAKGVELNLDEKPPKSLIKGALTNALSPHPYLFWFSVGAPTMTKAMNLNSTAPAVFIIGFYSFLIGSKVFLAVLVGKSRTVLSGAAYIFTMRFLGLTLCLLAIFLFYDGLSLLRLL